MAMTRPRAPRDGAPRAPRPGVGDPDSEPTEGRVIPEDERATTEALREMLRAALDLLAAPAFVLAPGGEVLESNAAGTDWLIRDPARAATLREAARGRPAAGAVVTRASGGPLVLVSHEPLERGARGLVAAASRRWRFTPREREVLALLLDGCSNRTIAATLAISVRTVETHLSSMFEKAAVESRAGLVARVQRP